jgi:hypothetical protein
MVLEFRKGFLTHFDLDLVIHTSQDVELSV